MPTHEKIDMKRVILCNETREKVGTRHERKKKTNQRKHIPNRMVCTRSHIVLGSNSGMRKTKKKQKQQRGTRSLVPLIHTAYRQWASPFTAQFQCSTQENRRRSRCLYRFNRQTLVPNDINPFEKETAYGFSSNDYCQLPHCYSCKRTHVPMQTLSTFLSMPTSSTITNQ